MERGGLRPLARRVTDFAPSTGRTIAFLEGGYDLGRVARIRRCHGERARGCRRGGQGDPSGAGGGLQWGNLAVVVVWGVAGLLLAIRFFRWTPRGG